MNRFEKAAYGGDDEYGEYDRWADGGPAWGLNKQKMIDMTRLFATEAARRKAQLQFHSDRYGADMYSPEEAVKRISAVANDKALDDVENLPNYYNLQYPLKPRSGILETLRLKSPGPIDDWGPDGHPMEAVNRSLMGTRSRSDSLKKAAAFGAMMGKRALFSSKFTPDLKLQMALIAEREKLVDDWENGDNLDWGTHPDMGGNPEFDRRWNKAFNEKKEVEPKAPPTPLYDSKPSWFPFRTQGMIDKARDAEYLRSDNEEAWDANDWKTEMALEGDHTREGVNNILNHYLDRNYGVVKNPYRKPEDIKDYPPNYTDMVDKNLPWKMNTEPDVVNSLFEQSTFPEYNDPTNRQKLFDEYYTHLDLAPSAKPSKKGPIAKAAAFGDSRDKLPTLYGSRFIPNSKLQHEMVKERQRLVDEWKKGWDKGDNTDWGDHPDMAGFDPDFENRWSEAFVGPEFDKHFDKNRLEKAAAFGAMMGKRAVSLSPTVLSSLAGAAVGGGGTAIYDWLKGTKENKLRRAMIGAGVGGLTGAGLGHLAGKLSPASKPEPLPTAPKVEKRVSGIGDLKDFGEDSLAASKSKLVDSIGKQDSNQLKIDAIKKRMSEDSHRVTGFREDVGRAQFEESGEFDRWLQRDAKDREALNSIYDIKTIDRASLLDDYNQFRSQSTSNALSKDRDRLLYDRDFVRKALASPADEPEGVFKKLFNGGNVRIKEYGVTNNYPDDGPGRLYYDELPDHVDFRSFRHSPKTYTPALNYKLGPWEGSGALTNRFFLPAGRDGYHPSGNSEAQEIKTLTSKPGAVK